ncbi:MAG: type II toxin-antitoxin system RelE/ParE family toxin [Candidatus Methylumidiphilus sp.]
MNYTLEFFAPEVKADILAWPLGIRAAFFRIVDRIKGFGPDLGLPYTRAMGGGLFEIRAQGAEGIGRVFFCTLAGRRVVILHSFIKKTQATPKSELAIAQQRMKQVKHERS